jgi:hypothetical protein
MSDPLIQLSDVKFELVTHEDPPKKSLYLAAGGPTRCQNRSCNKSFEGCGIHGDDDRYYCCEVCAQIGTQIEFDAVANGPRVVSST